MASSESEDDLLAVLAYCESEDDLLAVLAYCESEDDLLAVLAYCESEDDLLAYCESEDDLLAVLAYCESEDDLLAVLAYYAEMHSSDEEDVGDRDREDDMDGGRLRTFRFEHRHTPSSSPRRCRTERRCYRHQHGTEQGVYCIHGSQI